MSFRGLGCCPHHLVDCVENIVPQGLSEVHQQAGHGLVPLFSLFVLQPVYRQVEGDLWSGGRPRCNIVVCHAVALENILRVALLLDGDRPVFSVPGDVLCRAPSTRPSNASSRSDPLITSSVCRGGACCCQAEECHPHSMSGWQNWSCLRTRRRTHPA